jgi:hypothetical protein
MGLPVYTSGTLVDIIIERYKGALIPGRSEPRMIGRNLDIVWRGKRISPFFQIPVSVPGWLRENLQAIYQEIHDMH